jgi:hypothetical protein
MTIKFKARKEAAQTALKAQLAATSSSSSSPSTTGSMDRIKPTVAYDPFPATDAASSLDINNDIMDRSVELYERGLFPDDEALVFEIMARHSKMYYQFNEIHQSFHVDYADTHTFEK